MHQRLVGRRVGTGHLGEKRQTGEPLPGGIKSVETLIKEGLDPIHAAYASLQQGAACFTDIAYWLLPQFESYRSEEQRRRVLLIIARLPNCNAEGFRTLLVGEPGVDRTQRAEEELRDIILWDMEGMPASRDAPDLVIEALRDELVLTTENLQQHRFRGGLEVESLFGLRERAHFNSLPASAFRGPVLHLLRHHRRRALEFLVMLFNHGAEWYAGQNCLYPLRQFQHRRADLAGRDELFLVRHERRIRSRTQ